MIVLYSETFGAVVEKATMLVKIDFIVVVV